MEERCCVNVHTALYSVSSENARAQHGKEQYLPHSFNSTTALFDHLLLCYSFCFLL